MKILNELKLDQISENTKRRARIVWKVSCVKLCIHDEWQVGKLSVIWEDKNYGGEGRDCTYYRKTIPEVIILWPLALYNGW